MRTTVDLPADLHRAVASIAAHTQRSMSQTVADLIRRGLSPGGAAAATDAMRVDPLTGLPVIRSVRPVTPDDVRALEDE